MTTTGKLLPSLRSHSSQFLNLKLLSLKQNKDQAKIARVVSELFHALGTQSKDQDVLLSGLMSIRDYVESCLMLKKKNVFR